MIVDSQDIQVGMNIKFRTINGKDTNIIQGHVIAIADYMVAKIYSDILRYHQEVLESPAGSSLPTDPSVLNYFIIKDVQGEINAYAAEWVSETTLEIIADANKLIITIYDVLDTETDTILKLLKDNNYKALITG